MTSPTGAAVGAWLLKCNPQRWNLRRYVINGYRTIDSWTITVNHPDVAVGQPVLFWVTGSAGATPTPGLWGAGVVTGQHYTGLNLENYYWRLRPPATVAATWMPVGITLFDAPIPRYVLAEDPRLRDLQILRTPVAGNPQRVTPHQLDVIERYLTPADTATYGPSAQARAVVIDEYRGKGWRVERSTESGWDLTCRRGAQVLLVVARLSSEITLGRAEVAAANDPDWRLIVVDGTALIEYDGTEALDYAEPTTYAIPPPKAARQTRTA